MMQLMQRFLLLNKNKIIWLFMTWEVLMPVLWVYGAYVFISRPTNEYIVIYELGGLFGKLSFFAYCLTLIPGILKRFRLFPIVQVSLMLFRRHIGISMFLMALVHMGFVGTIPIIFDKGTPVIPTSPHILYGFASVLLLFPLWLTSNDFSVRTLRRNWQLLHKLTYVACFTIFMHVGYVEKSLALIAGIFILLEIASWVRVFWPSTTPPLSS